MEEFTDADAQVLLVAEWRSKNDVGSKTKYFFKFKVDRPRDRICIVITDTKSVWFEGLDQKHLIRRWRKLNPASDTKNPTTALRALHAPPTLSSALFSISEHPDADLMVQLSHGCAWTWECMSLGRSKAAAFLSTQLIEPLLDVARLAFSDERSMKLLAVKTLEKEVDRVAGTERHLTTVYTPRLVSTLRRMTAVAGSVDPAPPIVDMDEKVEQDEEEGEEDPSLERRISSPRPSTSISGIPPDPAASAREKTLIPSSNPPRPKREDSASATEPESDDEPEQAPRSASSVLSAKAKRWPSSDGASEEAQHSSSLRPTKRAKNAALSGSSSSPIPPPKSIRKKAILSPSSESESSPVKVAEDESSPPPPSVAAAVAKRKADVDDMSARSGEEGRRQTRPTRGVRQPLKRGGRRF